MTKKIKDLPLIHIMALVVVCGLIWAIAPYFQGVGMTMEDGSWENVVVSPGDDIALDIAVYTDAQAECYSVWVYIDGGYPVFKSADASEAGVCLGAWDAYDFWPVITAPMEPGIYDISVVSYTYPAGSPVAYEYDDSDEFSITVSSATEEPTATPTGTPTATPTEDGTPTATPTPIGTTAQGLPIYPADVPIEGEEAGLPFGLLSVIGILGAVYIIYRRRQ